MSVNDCTDDGFVFEPASGLSDFGNDVLRHGLSVLPSGWLRTPSSVTYGLMASMAAMIERAMAIHRGDLPAVFFAELDMAHAVPREHPPGDVQAARRDPE